MTPSPEQQQGIDAIRDSVANLLFSCPAGGGKTTLMTMLAKAVGPGQRLIALAFNKDAALALESKMPYFVNCSTFHSFCYDALGQHLGKKPRVDGSKAKWILKDLVPDWKDRSAIEDNVLTLVSRFKSTASPTGEKELTEVANRFDLDVGPRELALALKILAACLTPPFKTIDFDDMLWLVFQLGVKFPPVGIIFLDEAQDTNGIQRALLERILDSKGEQPCTNYNGFASPHNDIDACIICGQKKSQHPRLIAVGDPHQSIYGFRGADSNAMALLKETFSMTEIPLSVSYRCSQAVVTEARKYL
jgi:superfamily I DNA/RNA helicase